jgi:hypothetical protein
MKEQQNRIEGREKKVNNKGKDLKEQKGKWSVKLLIGTLVGCIIIVVILITTAELRQYQKGKKLFVSEDYEQAAIIFKELGNYKDSAQLYYECIYAIGKKQYENGHYTTAIDTLRTNLEYELARELFWKINLEYGKILMKSQNYKQAAIHLQEAGIEEARELYEKAIALQNSYVYKGKFYRVPEEIKEQVESVFLEKNITGFLSELTRAEQKETLCYYLLDEEERVQNAFISLQGYNEEQRNMTSLEVTVKQDKISEEKLVSILTGVIISCDSSMNEKEVLNIYNILQGQVENKEETTNQIITYERNSIKYTLNYNTKTSIYSITPIEK